MSQGQQQLFNMSVPSTSRISVARAHLPGRRFRLSLPEQLGREANAVRERLAKGGWRAAWSLLERAGCAPSRPERGPRRPEALEQHLAQACEEAGLPRTAGVFLDEDAGTDAGQLLSPEAALAVLARRSGRLYLPSRRPEPSLVQPDPTVLFFPDLEEVR